MIRSRLMSRRLVATIVLLAMALPAYSAALQLLLPLGRTAYQTDEAIDLSVVRTSAEALVAGDLRLTVTGDNGSKIALAFPAGTAPVAGAEARRTEHLHLNGWLLRPGRYTLEVACDGATAKTEIEVCSHIRKSTYRIIDWGGSGNGADQIKVGEDGTGVNLMYASYAGHDQDANIRGGIDYMRNCTMGGAHQMDGRLECDWSDPYVMAGGMARAARQALNDRRSPNTIGVHFYDEPGLTWQKHPQTGVFSPHNILSQDWAFHAAFGKPAMQYTEVNPQDPASIARWEQWIRWKQVFMEAAWRLGNFSVTWVNPKFLTATQSMYGWHAFGDGYYFNITRPLPVLSGHGGYDDYAGGFINPGFFFEFGRIREYHKPAWYLPQWWEQVPSELFRLEQYLTFMMGAHGLAIPPGIQCEAPGSRPQDDGMLESNKLMRQLGTIFTTMPVTRSEVAVLYSMSQNIPAMVHSENLLNGQDFPGQIERHLLLFVASKMAHVPLFPLVEEDVLDGSLAANHKAIVLTGIEALDPAVIKALVGYIAGGGRVILGDECKVQIPGAVKLGAEIHTRIYEAAQKEYRSGDEKTRRERGCTARGPLTYLREGAPIAKALAARCKEIGVSPIVECGNPQVFASNAAYGDVEYLFLANAAPDEQQVKKYVWNAIEAATADVALPDDGRPVYDAARGGEAFEFKKEKGKLQGSLRFGAGQLRAFARTARPIAGVRLQAPVLPPTEYPFPGTPNRVEIEAAVADAGGQTISGSIPVSVRVIDPLGVKRYDLLRATDRGVLRLALQLGVNEPAGEWKVVVRELLAGKQGSATFRNRTPAQCGAVAGATRRAVCFPQDYDNVFRFFRTRKNIALVIGSSDYNKSQAERLAENLKPWGFTCQIIAAADIKPKPRPPDAKKTWTGAVGNPDLDLPGDGAVLLGSPEDNAVINAMMPRERGFTVLPYVPVQDVFPGRGRGMIAWQTDAVAFYNYETVTLIAHDAEGLAEAAGTVFEIASGYVPATEWILPATAAVTPATQAPGLLPEAGIAWQAFLPDRAVSLTVDGAQVEALSLDGTTTRIGADGKVGSQKAGDAGKAAELFRAATWNRAPANIDQPLQLPTKVAKLAAKGANLTAVAYWGGWLQMFDAAGQAKTAQMLPQDVTGLIWQGDQLIAALADGRVLALKAP